MKKPWQWIKVETDGKVIKSSTCPITNQGINIGNLLSAPVAMRCKESINGKCAYCGDVSIENDTERKVQCFYPVVQNDKNWRPKKIDN